MYGVDCLFIHNGININKKGNKKKFTINQRYQKISQIMKREKDIYLKHSYWVQLQKLEKQFKVQQIYKSKSVRSFLKKRDKKITFIARLKLDFINN